MLNKIFKAVSILSLTFSAGAIAEQSTYTKGDKPLPKWEVGGVAAGFHSPLFPASKDNQDKFLLVPYGVYRGDKFSIGDGAIVKAKAVEAPRFKVDVSVRAAFNADSEDSAVREGMPDLDFLFEVGPQLRFLLSESSMEYSADSEVWLNLQARAVFSTDFGEIDQRGYVFQPQLSWRHKNLFFNDTITFASVSPIWASEKLHDYFYQVNEKYQNVEREAFDAEAGYLGTKVSIGNIFEIKKNMSIFFAAQWGIWKGSENENSPLFEKDINASAVLGVRYVFLNSDEMI